MLIYLRGTDATFTVHGELGGLCSLEGIAPAEDLFLQRREVLVPLELSWRNLKTVSTDGGKNKCLCYRCVRANQTASDASWLRNSDGISLHHSPEGTILPYFVIQG